MAKSMSLGPGLSKIVLNSVWGIPSFTMTVLQTVSACVLPLILQKTNKISPSGTGCMTGTMTTFFLRLFSKASGNWLPENGM